MHVDLDSPRVGATEGERRVPASTAATPSSSTASTRVLLALHDGLEPCPAFVAALLAHELAGIVRARRRAATTARPEPARRLLHDQRGPPARARRRRRWAAAARPDTCEPVYMAIASLSQFPRPDRAAEPRRCRRTASPIARARRHRSAGACRMRCCARRSRWCCAGWSRTGRRCAAARDVAAGAASPTCAGSIRRRAAVVATRRPAGDRRTLLLQRRSAAASISARSRCRWTSRSTTLRKYLDEPAPPAIYVASTTIDTCLPGFRDDNDLDLGERDALASIWIGNRTRIAAHQDVPDNIACVVAGRRRFTLFPPEQLRQPLHRPARLHAGRPGDQPGRFRRARLRALPAFRRSAASTRRSPSSGRAMRVFIPSMWWHHMEGAGRLQRAGELLVAAVAGVDGHADERADAGDPDACATCPPAQRAAWQRRVPTITCSTPTTHRRAHSRRRARRCWRRSTKHVRATLRARLLQATQSLRRR